MTSNNTQGWIDFRYTEFCDVPRLFIIDHDGFRLIFDSPYLALQDEYSDVYLVYALKRDNDNEDKKSNLVNIVPIKDIAFDSTRRKCIAMESVLALFKADRDDIGEYLYE